jgi:GNAT superfamily N-acetyltransferase
MATQKLDPNFHDLWRGRYALNSNQLVILMFENAGIIPTGDERSRIETGKSKHQTGVPKKLAWGGESLSTYIVRKIDPRDEQRWRELWDGYTRFYEREPSDAITRHTWARILDPSSPVHAIVAEGERGDVVGIANYIVHENTSALTPACYLQDLFVQTDQRAVGIGKLLIDWLVSEMKVQGWSRIYWNTKENNYRARGLYDKYTPHSGFLRYVIPGRLS